MPQVSLAYWQRFIADHPNAHLLQTAEWGELKATFGWDVLRLVCDGYGAQLLFRRLPAGFTVAYLPKPFFDPPAAPALLWEEVAVLCRQRRAIFLKLEPDGWTDLHVHTPDSRIANHQSPITNHESRLSTFSFRRSSFNIQPPRTLIVDLRGSEDDILARMKQKCRYNIRLAEKKGVVVHPWSDLEGFHRLMQATGERDAFGVHSLAYYKRAYELFQPVGACELLVAEYEQQPLAALMVFRQGVRSWYLYGASSDSERNRMPAYLLQWEAMRWAKSHGCEQYDLWGVPDQEEHALEAGFETRHDGLWGVYRFKRGFGGQLRRAPQSLDAVFNPLLYQLYLWRMARREAA